MSFLFWLNKGIVKERLIIQIKIKKKRKKRKMRRLDWNWIVQGWRCSQVIGIFVYKCVGGSHGMGLLFWFRLSFFLRVTRVTIVVRLSTFQTTVQKLRLLLSSTPGVAVGLGRFISIISLWQCHIATRHASFILLKLWIRI